MKLEMRNVLILAATIAVSIIVVALLRQVLIAADLVTLPASIVGGAAGGGAVAGILLISRSRAGKADVSGDDQRADDR